MLYGVRIAVQAFVEMYLGVLCLKSVTMFNSTYGYNVRCEHRKNDQHQLLQATFQ